MKVISTLTLIAVAAAFMAPNQAMAGDKEKAIIGGLIGGIIIGSVLADDDHHHTTVSYRYEHRSHCDHGRWEWVREKHWVPGYYERRCGRHGRSYKVWISGYYEYTKRKIWVKDCHCDHYSSNRSHYRSSGRYDRYDRHERHDRYDDRSDWDDRDHKDKRHYKNSGQMVRNF